MTTVKTDLNTGERYCVFAAQGNVLSKDGVTVVAQLEDLDITFEFWTRRDAIAFFSSLANAAERAEPHGDNADGYPISAGDVGTLISEGVTTSWETIEAGGQASERALTEE